MGQGLETDRVYKKECGTVIKIDVIPPDFHF